VFVGRVLPTFPLLQRCCAVLVARPGFAAATSMPLQGGNPRLETNDVPCRLQALTDELQAPQLAPGSTMVLALLAQITAERTKRATVLAGRSPYVCAVILVRGMDIVCSTGHTLGDLRWCHRCLMDMLRVPARSQVRAQTYKMNDGK
jgi:hypothetical protein